MSICIEKALEIIDESELNNGAMIVDKDGIVQWFGYAQYPNALSDNSFFQHIVGKHVVEIYPELSERTSSVIKVLNEGKKITSGIQQLTWNGIKMTLESTTYPIFEGDEIIGAVDVARLFDVKLDADELAHTDNNLYCLKDIIGNDEKIVDLKKSVKYIASNNSPVLIYGETGTGKQLFAESLHSEGIRRDKPFISQNCAAIPENLLESIFFGTEKGSFTGAESKAGLFEMANGGTLFLDEINSLDIYMQTKLLKAIEEKHVRRLGGKKDIYFDVRIVCATNEDPLDLIEAKRLRMDLYYRIGVIQLYIPALRERINDIDLLTKEFINQFNNKTGRLIKGINQDALERLKSLYWYGNVRELRNVIERVFYLENSSMITLSSIEKITNSNVRDGDIKSNGLTNSELKSCKDSKLELIECIIEEMTKENFGLTEALNEYEKLIISTVIQESTSLKNAAEKLKISPQKLNYRLKKLEIK